MIEKIQLPKLYRTAELSIAKVTRGDGGAEETSRYEIAISSEFEVERWFGTEVLEHSAKAIDLTRMQGGGPLLLDHDTREQIGAVENVRLDKDKVLRGDMRFSQSPRGQEVEQDVVDRIRKSISVGYFVDEYTEDVKASRYTATRWTPVEVSLVAVPADPTVGVGRGAEPSKEVRIIRSIEPAAREGAVTTEGSMETAVNNQQPTGSVPAAPAQPDYRQAAEIARVCAENGCAEMAADYITRNAPLETVCREILARRREAPITRQAAELRLDMTSKQLKQFSLVRALRMATANAEGQGEFDGFEREVSDEIARQLPPEYKRRGGFFLPMRTRAGLDSLTATHASELKYTEPGEFIELLRAASIAVRLGARVLPGLQGPVGFPKQTGSGTATWVEENPASDVAESNLTTGTVSLAPKTLQSTTSYSRQLLAQAIIDVEQLVREDLTAAHALAWDKAVFHGAGSGNEPTGIYALSGVNAVAVGGVPTFAKILEMVTAVATDNALLGKLGWATTPGMAGILMQTLVAEAAGAAFLWTGKVTEGVLAGYDALASNQIAADLGDDDDEQGLIFGNWADVLIGTWGAMEIIVDPYRLKKRAMIEVTSFEMVDIAVRHAESFAKGTGATLVPPAP